MQILQYHPVIVRPMIFIICLMLLLVPIAQVLAQTAGTQQEPSYLEVKTQAEADAKQDTSGIGYGFGGFFCGIFGWLFAMLISPDVPTARLIGKSPSYVAIYTESYKSKAKSIRTSAACIGWGIGAAVSLAILAATGGFEGKKTTQGY